MRNTLTDLIPLLLVVGCSSSAVPAGSPERDAGNADVAAGKDGTTAIPDAAVIPGDTGEARGPAACVESPQRRPGVRSIVTVDVDLKYQGHPVVFGEPFAAGGGSLTLTNFRFYVSELALVRAAGDSVPVDLVGEDGTPVPYNVHLINPEDPAGMRLRVSGPADDYVGISFLLGLSDACNQNDPGSSKPPLTAASQMTWPPPFGYLFLRYEATAAGVAATADVPTEIDVGGVPGYVFAPRVTAKGSFRIAAAPGGKAGLHMALEELFRAANMPAPASPMLSLGPAFLTGENVRQNAGVVSIFSLTTGP